MAIIVNGKELAQILAGDIRKRLEKLGQSPTLALMSVTPDEVTESYLRMKMSVGQSLGIKTVLHKLNKDSDLGQVREYLEEILSQENVSGLVVQLPLPSNVPSDKILSLIPPDKDPDALSPFPMVKSPVAKAVEYILDYHQVDLSGKRVAVVGFGRLVGQPVCKWLESVGVDVQVVTRQYDNKGEVLRSADIVITGVGAPNLIEVEDIKEGAVVIDAGTSESGGKLVGDVDRGVESKASILTPVPGGVGPLAVMCLFSNLVDLIEITHP